MVQTAKPSYHRRSTQTGVLHRTSHSFDHTAANADDATLWNNDSKIAAKETGPPAERKLIQVAVASGTSLSTKGPHMGLDPHAQKFQSLTQHTDVTFRTQPIVPGGRYMRKIFARTSRRRRSGQHYQPVCHEPP